MNSTTYQHYLKDWLSHKSTQWEVEIPTDITGPIIQSLRRNYEDLNAKRPTGSKIDIVSEKFVYVSAVKRYGFQSTFKIIPPEGNIRKINVLSYINSDYQRRLKAFQRKFISMAKAVFGPKIKLYTKIRCNPDTGVFLLHLRIQ